MEPGDDGRCDEHLSYARGSHLARGGLETALGESFKISNDPEFEAKVVGIVGLYMNPLDHALVVCVDEKSQIQALDRTKPGAALGVRARGNGDARLQAAWHHDAIRRARCPERSRYRRIPTAPGESLKFLWRIDRAVRQNLKVLLILDN